MKSCKLSTLFMNFHFCAFKFIQFFPYCCLVCRCEPGPGLVCSAIIVRRIGHFNILVKPQDPSGLEFCHCGPEAQLQEDMGEMSSVNHIEPHSYKFSIENFQVLVK